LQFGLRSLFLLTTVAATVSALGHYFPEIVLRWFAIGVFLMITLALMTLGPGLVTEVLTLIVDKSLVLIAIAKRTLHRRLTVAANASGQHDAVADNGRPT